MLLRRWRFDVWLSPNTLTELTDIHQPSHAHRISRKKIEHIIAAYRFGIDYINRRVLERQQIVTALSKQQLLEFLAPHLF